MKTIDQILDKPIKLKSDFEYIEKCHETYHGVNMNIYTNEDISEAINTTAGIDDYARR